MAAVDILQSAFRTERERVGPTKALANFNATVAVEMVGSEAAASRAEMVDKLLKTTALGCALSAVGFCATDAPLISSVSALLVWPAYSAIQSNLSALEDAYIRSDELDKIHESVNFEASIKNSDGTYYTDDPVDTYFVMEPR